MHQNDALLEARRDSAFQFFLARCFGIEGTIAHPYSGQQVYAYLWRGRMYLTNRLASSNT